VYRYNITSIFTVTRWNLPQYLAVQFKNCPRKPPLIFRSNFNILHAMSLYISHHCSILVRISYIFGQFMTPLPCGMLWNRYMTFTIAPIHNWRGWYGPPPTSTTCLQNVTQQHRTGMRLRVLQVTVILTTRVTQRPALLNSKRHKSPEEWRSWGSVGGAMCCRPRRQI
jgi:hypothetical protein